MMMSLALSECFTYFQEYHVNLTSADDFVQPQLVGWNLEGEVLECCVGAGVVLRINILANAVMMHSCCIIIRLFPSNVLLYTDTIQLHRCAMEQSS